MKGCVRKRGNKYKIVVSLGKNPDTGKRDQNTKSGFTTKRDANKVLRQWLVELDENRFVQPKKESFASYIKDWFAKKIENNNKETSVQVKRYMVEKHLIKDNPFSNKPLDSITSYDIDSLYNLKLKEGYSPIYIRKIHHNIQQALEQAVDWEKIKSNPANKVSLPKNNKGKKPKIKIWSYDEIRTFLAHSEGTRNHIAFQIDISTGMRRGELLALQWDQVDLDKKIIHVLYTLSYSKEEGYYLSTPKTDSSIRKITISDELAQALKEHKKRQDDWKKTCVPLYNDKNLVIAKENGDFYAASTLTRDMKVICKKAGVSSIRFHDIRHTHASILIAEGVDIVKVSKRLGHSSPKITLEIYAHSFSDTDYEVADIFQTALLQPIVVGERNVSNIVGA